MSMQSRLERAHQAEVDALQARVSEGVRALEACEEAKGKIAEDLAREKEKTRARDEELVVRNRRVAELGLEVEKFRQEFVLRDTQVASLDARLDLVTRELEESEAKVTRMNGMCRRQVRRMLKDQRGEFRKECRKQSRRAVRIVRSYLESRRPWHRVDKLVSQAEEAERILLCLRAGGVPIPEDKLADVAALKEKYSAERASIKEETLSAEDFGFHVPSDLGVPNLDQVDFSAAFAFGEEDEEFWGGSTDEEDRDEGMAATEEEGGSEEDEEEEDEEGEEEEEEEEEEDEIPLLAKGAASVVRPRSDDLQPVSGVGGSTQDAREGGEENRSAATAVSSEALPGVGSVPVVPNVVEGSQLDGGETQPMAEDVTVVVRPEGGGSDEVPPTEGEKTPQEGQLGGDGSEEVPRVGDGTSLAAKGASAGVPPGGVTPPVTWGSTSGVPEEGERERVQLEGDVSPPEVEG